MAHLTDVAAQRSISNCCPTLRKSGVCKADLMHLPLMISEVRHTLNLYTREF